jgi:hypothetical protein
MEPIREHDARLREVFAEYEIIDAHVHPPTPLPNTDFHCSSRYLSEIEHGVFIKFSGILKILFGLRLPAEAALASLPF